MVVDADYQAEVDAASERLAAHHRRVRRRAEGAERRARRLEVRAACDGAARAVTAAAEKARAAASAAWIEFQQLDRMVRARPFESGESGRVHRVGVAGADPIALGPDELRDRGRGEGGLMADPAPVDGEVFT